MQYLALVCVCVCLSTICVHCEHLVRTVHVKAHRRPETAVLTQSLLPHQGLPL